MKIPTCICRISALLILITISSCSTSYEYSYYNPEPYGPHDSKGFSLTGLKFGGYIWPRKDFPSSFGNCVTDTNYTNLFAAKTNKSSYQVNLLLSPIVYNQNIGLYRFYYTIGGIRKGYIIKTDYSFDIYYDTIPSNELSSKLREGNISEKEILKSIQCMNRIEKNFTNPYNTSRAIGICPAF